MTGASLDALTAPPSTAGCPRVHRFLVVVTAALIVCTGLLGASETHAQDATGARYRSPAQWEMTVPPGWFQYTAATIAEQRKLLSEQTGAEVPVYEAAFGRRGAEEWSYPYVLVQTHSDTTARIQAMHAVGREKDGETIREGAGIASVRERMSSLLSDFALGKTRFLPTPPMLLVPLQLTIADGSKIRAVLANLYGRKAVASVYFYAHEADFEASLVEFRLFIESMRFDDGSRFTDPAPLGPDDALDSAVGYYRAPQHWSVSLPTGWARYERSEVEAYAKEVSLVTSQQYLPDVVFGPRHGPLWKSYVAFRWETATDDEVREIYASFSDGVEFMQDKEVSDVFDRLRSNPADPLNIVAGKTRFFPERPLSISTAGVTTQDGKSKRVITSLLLGRYGLLSIVFPAADAEIEQHLANFKKIIDSVRFDDGHRYADRAAPAGARVAEAALERVLGPGQPPQTPDYAPPAPAGRNEPRGRPNGRMTGYVTVGLIVLAWMTVRTFLRRRAVARDDAAGPPV